MEKKCFSMIYDGCVCEAGLSFAGSSGDLDLEVLNKDFIFEKAHIAKDKKEKVKEIQNLHFISFEEATDIILRLGELFVMFGFKAFSQGSSTCTQEGLIFKAGETTFLLTAYKKQSIGKNYVFFKSLTEYEKENLKDIVSNWEGENGYKAYVYEMNKECLPEPISKKDWKEFLGSEPSVSFELDGVRISDYELFVYKQYDVISSVPEVLSYLRIKPAKYASF